LAQMRSAGRVRKDLLLGQTRHIADIRKSTFDRSRRLADCQSDHWHLIRTRIAAEKEKINLWKEDFDKNVIKRALADHEPTTSVPTSAILGSNPNREVIEVEDSQSQSSQEEFHLPKRQKFDDATDSDRLTEGEEN